MEQTVAELPVMDRAWTWFQENKKQITWGTGAVLVIGLAVGFYSWRQVETENAAGAALSAVESQRMMPGAARNESSDAYLKVANEHAGTKSGARALLLAAGANFVEGKYGDAQSQFQRFLTEYADNPLRGQALFGTAACLDAQGKADEAAVAYKNVVDRHPGESVLAPAKFSLARIHEAQGKLESAAKLYEELIRGEATGTMANEAGLKAQELRAKLPPPAPLTASPAVPEIPALSTPAGVTPNAAPAAATNKP